MKAFDRVLQRLRIARVRPYVDRYSRVLDIGCFDAALHDQLGPFALYLGVDPEATSVCHEPPLRLVRGVFPNSAVPVGSFDVITALAVLEHVPVPAQATFAESCFTALAPGGRLIVTVPSPLVDPILDLLQKCRVLDGMETEQHYGFDPLETPGIFSPAGFWLEHHQRFELGLNHLFVFRRPERAQPRSGAAGGGARGAANSPA